MIFGSAVSVAFLATRLAPLATLAPLRSRHGAVEGPTVDRHRTPRLDLTVFLSIRFTTNLHSSPKFSTHLINPSNLPDRHLATSLPFHCKIRTTLRITHDTSFDPLAALAFKFLFLTGKGQIKPFTYETQRSTIYSNSCSGCQGTAKGA